MSQIFKKKVDKMMKNRKGNLRKKNLKMMKKMTITRVIVKVTIIIVLKLHKMFKNKIMITAEHTGGDFSRKRIYKDF
jgi:uncharacterized membrane protein YvbJ